MEELIDIYYDCIELEAKGFLTESGRGELHILRILRNSNL
mgnify:CR=1 FL=1